MGSCSVPDASAPPALRADVGLLPLAELLRAIHAAGASGYLHFAYREHEKAVYVQRGEVVFATSNQRVDRLGECLLRAGVLRLEELREAERAFAPPARFGKALVERGLLTPRELWNGVQYQVEEIVRSLFAYPAGVLRFWEGDFHPDNVVRLSLETGRLVAEGGQRREELRKFLAVLEDPRVRLATAEGFRGELAGAERELAEAIGAGRSFPDLCEALELTPESTARSVQLLRLVGAVQLVRRSEEGGSEGRAAFATASSAESEGLRESAAARVKLIAELAGEIARAEGSRAVEGRLARVLDEAARRYPVLLDGIALAPGAALDADRLVERAETLPGDRDAALSGALGELVAYLEFELVNHPAVREADAVLARLEPLRRAAFG